MVYFFNLFENKTDIKKYANPINKIEIEAKIPPNQITENNIDKELKIVVNDSNKGLKTLPQIQFIKLNSDTFS